MSNQVKSIVLIIFLGIIWITFNKSGLLHLSQLNKEKELIWFLNHDNIYTQGTSAKNNEIISKVKVPIIKTNRGIKVLIIFLIIQFDHHFTKILTIK